MESLPRLSVWALVLEKSRQLRTVLLRRAAACAEMSTTDPFTPLGPYSREMDWGSIPGPKMMEPSRDPRRSIEVRALNRCMTSHLSQPVCLSCARSLQWKIIVDYFHWHFSSFIPLLHTVVHGNVVAKSSRVCMAQPLVVASHAGPGAVCVHTQTHYG